jgi:hypothetical protein
MTVGRQKGAARALRLGLAALGCSAILGATACRRVDEIAAPQVTLPSIEVRSYSGGEADLMLGFAVGNPNSYDLTLVQINGTLYLSDQEAGPVVWSGEQECKKQGAVQARIPMHLQLGHVAGGDSLLAALVDRKQVRQAVRGEMTFARGVIRRTFPIATDGRRADAPAR